jgi:hypothetical protein
MDPFSAGLGLASAGVSILFLALARQRTSASIAEAGLKAAQNAALLEGREQNKGQLAGALYSINLFDAEQEHVILLLDAKRKLINIKVFNLSVRFERALNTENIERERAFEMDLTY